MEGIGAENQVVCLMHMESDNMLEVVRTAGELAVDVNILTAKFPPEDQHVMVPILRDHALTVIEQIALGTAQYRSDYRLNLLRGAITSLKGLSSRLALCRSIGLVPTDKHALLDHKISTLSKLLAEAIESIRQSDSAATPPS